MNDKILMALARIVDFRNECEESEYTDTGDAWELINGLARLLNEIVLEPEGPALAEALRNLNSAYARHQLRQGYTHLFSDDLQGAIINVIKAAGLED